MTGLPRALLVAIAWAGVAAGQNLPSDLSFMNVSSPGSCGTPDNAIVTSQQLFGTGSGFACMKTLIFPQFAVGGGWTTQITGLMPVQPPTAGLVGGATEPGFAVSLTPGSSAAATLFGSSTPVLFSAADGGCLALWNGEKGAGSSVPYTFQIIDIIDSGTADHGSFTSLANIGGCGSNSTDTQISGSAQGPMQLQVFAPNSLSLSQATAQLSYFYNDPTFSWQVNVSPVDINSAKKTWTAPLYQGAPYNYVTAFSVVNASNVQQSVTINLRDGNGNPIGTYTTPQLAAGCGCNQLNQSAAGGFYANTVSTLFPSIGNQAGSIEFDGTSNIVVLVLRAVNNTLGSVPVK